MSIFNLSFGLALDILGPGPILINYRFRLVMAILLNFIPGIIVVDNFNSMPQVFSLMILKIFVALK